MDFTVEVGQQMIITFFFALILAISQEYAVKLGSTVPCVKCILNKNIFLLSDVYI